MAEDKIYSKDVIEKGFFDNAKKSAEEFIQSLLRVDKQLVDIANIMKNDLKSSNDVTLSSLKATREAINNVNQAYDATIAVETEKLKLDREKIKNETLLSRQRQQESKERIQLNRETEISNKATEREVKLKQQAESYYARLNKILSKLRNEYRELAIKQEAGISLSVREQAKMLAYESRIQKLDTAFKKVDGAMGQHQRNVGNYSSAWNGLQNSVNQLTREMPAFANSVQTGFMAISNNLPTFFDEINKIKTVNKELIAQGQPVKSAFSQIGASIFSLGTALSVGVTLLTVYGSQISDYIYNTFIADKETKRLEETKRRQNEEFKKSNEYIAKESAEFVGNVMALKQTNSRSKERAELIEKINKQYGTTLKNITDETKFQQQLNIVMAEYMQYKKAEYEIKRNEEKIALNLQYQSELNRKITKEKQYLLKLEKQLSDEQNRSTFDIVKQYGNSIEAARKYDSMISLLTSDIEDQKKKLSYLNMQSEIYNRHLEDYSNGIFTAQQNMKNLGFTTSETTQELTDLSRQIRDERIKQLDDERQREIETLKASYEDRKADILKEKTDRKQLKQYLKELDKTYLVELNNLYDKFDEEDRKKMEEYYKYVNEYVQKEVQLRIDAEKKIKEEKDKVNQSKLDELDELDRIEKLKQELIITTSKETEKKKNEQLRQLKIDQLKEEIALETTNQEEKIKKQIELAKLENQINDEKKKSYKDLFQNVKKTFDDLAAIEEQYLNARIQNLDTYINAQKEQQSKLKDLANQGNIDAQQSIALEQDQINKATADKMKAEKKLQDLKMFTAVINAFANSGNVGQTLSDVGQLIGGTKALLSSIPSYDVGTDNTGQWNDAGLDGKGGRAALIHPNEMILTSKQTNMVGGRKAQEVAETMFKYNSGLLIEKSKTNDSAGNSYQLANIMKELNDNIKSMPKDEYQVYKIAHDTMAFTHKRRVGNATLETKYIRS